METAEKRKIQPDEKKSKAAPAISKKRKRDLAWLKEGLSSEDPYETLKRFHDDAKAFLSKQPGVGDVVKDFLQNGGTGKEFLDLLTETNKAASKAATIFKCIQAIMQRMASDLTEYRDIGANLASSILKSHMKNIYHCMSRNATGNQAKSAIGLLTSMVTLGHLTAREVIARVDFAHESVIDASQRTYSDAFDVRSSYVTFITSFLMEEDSMLLRTFGENPAILRPVFDHLQTDKAKVVQIFLTTMRDKLVMSDLLSKTLKIHIFNSWNLSLLLKVFSWTGPQKSAKGLDAKMGPANDEDSEEDKILVAECLQSLLLALTTSHKFGIAFADFDLGVGAYTRNGIIFKMFQDLHDFWVGPSPRIVEIQSLLVIKTTEKCPDLVDCYLNYVYEELDHIRISPAWVSLCSVVLRIIEVQNLLVIFNPREKHTVGQQALRAATLLGPCSLPKNFFSRALMDESPAIKLTVGRILQTVLKKVEEFQRILFHDPKARMYSESEKNSIFKILLDKLVRQMPECGKLIELCCQMPSFKGKPFYIDCWVVTLDILARYAKLGWIPNESSSTFPVENFIQAVLACSSDSSVDKKLLESLQLSAFTYVSSLPQIPTLSGSQLEALIPQIAQCLIDTDSAELRSCTNTMLYRLAPHQGTLQLNLSPDEFSIWIWTLERHPEAVSIFSRMYSTLLLSPTGLKEELESTFGTANNGDDQSARLPCSPLVLIASTLVDSSENEETDLLVSYVSAAVCELVLAQKSPMAPFANILKKSLAKKLRAKLKVFFSSATGGKKKSVDIAELGLSCPAAILYASCFTADVDWDSLHAKWKEVMSSIAKRTDLLQVVLNQTITCLDEATSHNADQVNMLALLKVVIDIEEESSYRGLLVKLLQDGRVVRWFNPMKTDDPFAREFSTFVLDSLKLIPQSSLHQVYNKAYNEAIAATVKGTEALPLVDETELFLSLSQLKIGEIEPQITSLVGRLKKKSDDNGMRYLNVFLRLAAQLRLQGALQRISWPAFSPALQLFVSLRAPVLLQRGIYDVLSVCPEFFGSIDKLTNLMRACLDSPTDHTLLCLLVMTSSDQLCAAFGQLCLAKEEHFEEISWRLQILPAYLSTQEDDKVLDMLHRKISPALKKVMTTRSEYEKAAAQLDRLPEFIHMLVSKCWSAEDCHDLATTILAECKKELSCAQFVEAGRRGNHHQLHAKLCLLATVRQLKSAEPDTKEIAQLSQEFDWLSRQTHIDLPVIIKSILGDAVWDKFVKYTLRIGLHASDTAGSTLPPLALQLMTSMWRLLLQGPSDEITALSLKVYEMIIGHSEFIPVMMDEKEFYVEQKKALLQLLTVLIQVNPKLCRGSQVPLLLSSYFATRSTSDQLILSLLRSYEKNGVILSPYKPYLWGQAAAAHYSIQRGTGTRASQMPGAGEVLTLLNSQMLLKTAYQFPIELKLNGTDVVAESEDYDPRFILSLLAHILSPEYSDECNRITQSGAVSFLMSTLSSSCGDMRSLGWLALGRLYQQFEKASNWPEGCLWIHLVDCVRYGAAEYFRERFGAIRTVPPKISSIITLFLAKAAAIIRDPLHPLYRPINNFLLVKPALDVNQVPEFFVMLHCTELQDQRKLHREFLFSLLRDGIRSRQDYLVCARRRVFRILLSLEPSNLLTDRSEKRLILEVVKSSLENSIIAHDLILHRGLIMWLDSLLLTEHFSDDANLVLSVVETLWKTLFSHVQRKRNSQEKDEEKAIAEFVKEVSEAEKEGKKKASKPTDKTTGPSKTPNAKLGSRKPIWDLLPPQQQIVAPWIASEIVQLMINLWRVLYYMEPNFTNFDKFTSVLCSVASHIHESKKLIREAQKKESKSVRFVAPPKLLNIPLMRQLVQVSSRFVSDLPDLKDHLEVVESSKVKTFGNPTSLTKKWQQSHEHMRKLTNQEERNITTRYNLHMLLSLTECGV